jgi:hypothetical protein
VVGAVIGFGNARVLYLAGVLLLYVVGLAPRRAIAGEAALLVAGLVAASLVGGPSVLSTALAVWTFLLVQSLAFALAPQPRGVDPFDEAYRRAHRLLPPGGAEEAGAGPARGGGGAARTITSAHAGR